MKKSTVHNYEPMGLTIPDDMVNNYIQEERFYEMLSKVVDGYLDGSIDTKTAVYIIGVESELIIDESPK